MKTMLLGVVAALALLCGRAEAVTVGPGAYTILGNGVITFRISTIIDNMPNYFLAPTTDLSKVGGFFLSASATDGRGLPLTAGCYSNQIGSMCGRSMVSSDLVTLFASNGSASFNLSGSVTWFGVLAGLSQPTFTFDMHLPAGVSLVPLPGSLPLFASGVALVGWFTRRRHHVD